MSNFDRRLFDILREQGYSAQEAKQIAQRQSAQRERIATAAMQGLLAANINLLDQPKHVAKHACAMADALIAKLGEAE